MALRLHEATHDAVREEKLVSAERHGRDNGVVWPLTALDADRLGHAAEGL